MKIKYEFITGETVEVEVDDSIGNVVVELDRIEYNNEKKETRRHCAMSAMKYDGEWFVSDKADPGSDMNLEKFGYENERLNKALSALSKKQRDIYLAIYRDGYTITEYAEEKNISVSAACKLLGRANEKIKLFF